MGSLERNYWNNRYLGGGNSGIGSVGRYREWFWTAITKHISTRAELDDVIDVGCGDLSFWEGRSCERYVGTDISNVIVQRNKIHRPEWRFVCCDAANYIGGLTAETVLCIAVLFHIEKDADYQRALENMCRYSQKWIVVSTWMKRPPSFDSTYQFYRRFEHYFDVFHRNGFPLYAASPCFDGVNAVYVFKKVEAESVD